MASNSGGLPAGAVVTDSNVVIAMTSVEAGRSSAAQSALSQYLLQGYALYAPAIAAYETLYVLCGKLASGLLTANDYRAAIAAFQRAMTTIKPPPNGEMSLITRAEQIAAGYGCSRSADSFYIALAEEFTRTVPTSLLTFDRDLPKQAARNAPTVQVHLL